MSNQDTKWPTPLKDTPGETAAALAQYQRDTNEVANEGVAYGRVVAKLGRSPSRSRWLLATTATAVAVPMLIWLLRPVAAPDTMRAAAPATTSPQASDGDTWSASLPTAPRPDQAPPQVARHSSPQDCARFGTSQLQEQLTCYRKQARKRGPEAERAQYALARLQRDVVGDLAAALDALEEQRTRFPRGKLKIDADRGIIELLQRLGRPAEALAETQMFLDEHPQAEYRAEMRLVRGDIYRTVFRDPASAEREYSESATAEGRTGDDSRFLRALCLEALGRMDEARSAYEEYLAQAGTAHAAEVKRRMERLPK